VVAVLAVVGCVTAWRRPRQRWLVAAHAVAGGLFVLVAGSDARISRMVSAAWWDDPYRLAALAGVTGVPLAAVGLDAVVRWVAARLPGEWPIRHLAAVTGALLVATAVAAAGLSTEDTTQVVATEYQRQSLLTPAEQSFLADVPATVPVGERVAGNPWNGAALSGPVAGREAVFPHLVGRWGADRDLLARSLRSVSTDPGVCAALRRLSVQYVLVGKPRFWSGDPRRRRYAGLEVAGREGFTRVGGGGGLSLWRVTACEGTRGA
jgi:hypothetical protein